MKINSIILFLLAALSGYGQDVKYLYYSNQNNLNGDLIILDENYSVVSTPFAFYLLNAERIMVDTLVIENSTSNFHQVQRISVINNTTISVASFLRSLLVHIENDSFIIEKEVELTNEFKKQNGKIDLIQIFPEGIIARSKKTSKTDYKNGYKIIHYFIPYNEEIIEQNITPPAPIKSEYLRYVGFGSNLFIYANHNIIFNNKEINQLYVYSTQNGTTRVIPLPEVDINSETNDFFYDYIANKYYIINYRLNKKTKISEYFPATHTYKFVKDFDYPVSGIINGQVHVMGDFGGRQAHYLIPLQGDVAPVKVIDDEN